MRKTVAVLLALFALYMLVVVFTIPAIATPGPAMLMIASVAGAYLCWPKKKQTTTGETPGKEG